MKRPGSKSAYDTCFLLIFFNFLMAEVRFILISIQVITLFGSLTSCSQLNTEIPLSPSTNYSLKVSHFQRLPLEMWSIDSANRVWTNSRTIHIAGSTVRGVKFIQVKNAQGNLLLGDPISVLKDKTFEWSSTVPADGEYHFTLQPLSRKKIERGKASLITIVVDTVAPDPPVITTHQGLDFVSRSSIVTLNGTVSDTNIAEIKTNGDGLLTFMSGSIDFIYQLNLVPRQSQRLTFVAVDRAGNLSVATSISVSYLPQLRLRAFNLSSMGANQSPYPSPQGSLVLGFPSTSSFAPTGNFKRSQRGSLKVSIGSPSQVVPSTP